MLTSRGPGSSKFTGFGPVNVMAYHADAIVVGSGPSGVSVAWPMLEAGMRVLLLDGGRQRESPVPAGAYHDIRRRDPEQWRRFLGRDLEALRPVGPPSPKFDAPGSRFAFEGDAASERVHGRGFAAIVSLAPGGLSNIWGAGIATYGEQELADFPLSPEDLAPSYRTVARRIGVTGFAADDLDSGLDGGMPSQAPMRLSENAARMAARYERNRAAVQALGVRLGRPRIAVLTEPLGRRAACTLCDMCIWGCSEDSIYSAAHDLVAMQAHEDLDYRPGSVVESIAPFAEGYRVTLRGAGQRELTCRRLVLAAGALVTTRLVLEMQGRFDDPVPVVGAPGIGFALCLPGRIGAAVSPREFSMGQLSFTAAGDATRPADGAYGNLFPASGVPGSLVIERMPLTRPAAVRLFRWLQPSLVLGNCFLPGRYSRNTARLERGPDGRGRLVVRGGVADELPRRIAALRSQLMRAFRMLGAHVVPSSFSPMSPGEAIRYAGTLPMRAAPGPGETDATGELYGAPGLHIVDLSIFPSMPAKPHTLTMMANADRIGRTLAAYSRDA
jgi:choline dehydrogenase-like flavoprotein